MIGRLLLGWFLLVGLAVSAQAETKVTGSLDRPAIGVGESAVLTIRIEGGGSGGAEPVFETPDGLRIRDAGQSRSFSLVNGRFTQSLELSYAVAGLRAGDYEIGPIEVEISGRLYRVGPFRLTVGPSSRSTAPGRRKPSPEPAVGGESPPLLVEMDVEPPEVYVGQQLLLRVRFWQREDLRMREARFLPPETEGFWKEDLPPERRGRARRDGAVYEVTEILAALFPTRTGALAISPARVLARYREPSRRRTDRFFPFGLSGPEKEVELSSKGRTVQVLPLPSPRPEGFTGAVGRYRIASRLDREEAVQGEPITWTLDVAGTGNVAALELPPFPEIPGCRGFDAGSEVTTTRQDDRVGGTKSFSRVLIPEAAGMLELPEVRWVYFDPAKKGFETLRLPARTLAVRPAAADGRTLGGRIGGSIRTIRTEGRLEPLSSARPWRLRSFWLLQIVPAGAVALGLGAKRRRERIERDPAGARLRAAPRRLRAALRAVQQDASDPWGDLLRAVETFLADRYGPEVRGMTREALRRHLTEAGGEPEAAADLSKLLAEVEARRFASAGDAEEAGIAEAVQAVSTLAARLKRRKHG